jgi:polysaccharide chain length determinant protein (PEP-CTERM system associated)
MEQLIRMTDLDLNVKTDAQKEALINKLKSSIQFVNTKRQNLYTISYANNDPNVAYNVVNSLLTIFVESSLGESRKGSDTAQTFLDKQIKEYEEKLEKAEDRLKEFKGKNYALMSSTGYFQRLQTMQEQYNEANLQLQEAINRRNELKRQIRGEEPAFGLSNDTNVAPASHPLDGRISSLEIKLDELLLKYTDRHPDIVAVRDTLNELRKRRSADIEAQGPKQKSQTSFAGNPVYQQMRISLGESEARVASLSVRVREYRDRIKDLKEKVNLIPKIEADLKALNRNYENDKSNYNALVSSREAAIMSGDIEETGEDVKFKIIDPPAIPLKPSAPNRTLLASMTVVGALGAGIAFAFLLSQIRPAIYDRTTLRKVSGFPVFGSISYIMTPDVYKRRRLQLGAFLSVGGLLFLLYGGVITLFNTGQFRTIQQIMRTFI